MPEEPTPALEPTPPSEEPITPAVVAGEPPTAPAVPDSSIIADRVNQGAATAQADQQRQAQEAEAARLQEELQSLRALSGTSVYGETIPPPPVPAESDQSQALKSLQADMAEMKRSNTDLHTLLQQRQEQSEYVENSNQVSAWVTENENHFPLLNAVGQQRLVYQRMYNGKAETGQMMSESKAAGEIESEIVMIVERCAPQLGYAKGNVKPVREDQVSINAAMNIAEPLDRDKMSDEEHLAYLLREAQGQ